MEGCVSTRISQDGWNATEKLAKLISSSRFKPQLHAILLKGITLGGFNLVDIQALHEKTQLPVLVVMRKPPDYHRIYQALTHLSLPKKRWKIIQKAGEPFQEGRVYLQTSGLSKEDARELLQQTTARGNIPEALRVAHIIARGLVLGESRGRP